MTNSRQEKHELLVWRVSCFLIMCEFYHINLLQNNDDHNDGDVDDDIITMHFLLYWDCGVLWILGIVAFKASTYLYTVYFLLACVN
jgi:hypothetical protein